MVLVVAVFVIVFLARRDGDAQPVFLWRQRTRSICRDRARRIVSAVEVEHDRAIGHWAGLEESAAGISLSLALWDR